MNGNIPDYIDKTIGTDPTTIPVVDTLDFEPTEKSNSNKQKKKGSLLKKVLFTIIILALMGAVAYGIFYYLNLANNSKTGFELIDKTIPVNSELSKFLNDYGTFTNIDTKKCTLNFEGVDTSKEGTYTYSVSCNNIIKKAKIIVSVLSKADIETKLAIKKISDTIDYSDFIASKDGYTYEFANVQDPNSYLNNTGEIKIVEINIQDSNNNMLSENGLLMVYDDVSMYLTCSKDHETRKFAFDSSQNRVENAIYIYEKIYSSKEEYDTAINSIVDYEITIDDNTGYALKNPEMLSIKAVSLLKNSDLEMETTSFFPSTLSEVQEFYQNEGYNCSI